MGLYKNGRKIAGIYVDHEIEDATEQHRGIIQIATQDEVQQGVNDSKAVTPKKIKHIIDTDLNNYNISKIEDYLYTIHYNTNQLDYNYAINYFLNNYHNTSLGGCTSLRKDNFFGRNYDWTYSNCVSFVVKKEAGTNRYASIGLAGGIEQLTKNIVETHEWNNIYKILPYFLLDGINEHGLTVSMNVVPSNQKGTTTGTHSGLSGDNICMLMLPSYLLDNFKTATEAVSWIENIGKIYAPSRQGKNQELHFLIADKNNTYVVEFIDNVARIINDRNYITNFYLDGTAVGQDGKINYSSVTPYGQGLERYDIITESYNSLNSLNDVFNLMRSLNYTHAYNADDLSTWWKTEFVAPYADEGKQLPNLTVTTPVRDFVSSGLIDIIENQFRTRTREEGNTWQTVHTSVYDIDKKQFLLITQEQEIDKVRTFQLFNTIGDGKLIVKQDNVRIGEYTANQNLDTEINIDLSDYATNIDLIQGLATKSNISLSNLDELGEKRFTDLQTAIDTKANESDLTAHTDNTTIHVTASDKIAWSQKQNTSDNTLTTTDKTIVGALNELNAKPAGLPTYIEETETLRFGE